MTPQEYRQAAESFEHVEALQSGKRCGVRHSPWMGDWFVSWSPRNDNEYAEGPWAHWVDLAVRILRDPMTELVRADAHEAAKALEPRDFYSEADRYLTDDELLARFASPEPGDAEGGSA